MTDKHILQLAKSFHDGMLSADDHEFTADSEQGKWCIAVAQWFDAHYSKADAEYAPKLAETLGAMIAQHGGKNAKRLLKDYADAKAHE